MRTDNQRKIIDALSEEIFTMSQACASEQQMPARGTDESDQYMAELKGNIQELRMIRAKLEDLFTGIL